MRVAIDATPMLEAPSGIPTYCRELVTALVCHPALRDSPPHLVTFSVRGAAPRVPGTTRALRRLPARALRLSWERSDVPRVEVVSGRCDVFHGTNFVSPPSRAAAVVTVHDLSFLTHPTTVRAASLGYDRLLRRAVSRGRLVVVCPSESVSNQVRETYRLPAEQVVTTPLAAAGDWSTAVPLGAAEAARIGLPERYLVFVGTAEPRKNLAVLLHAQAAATSGDRSHPVLVVVGGAGWGAALGPGEGVLRLGRLAGDTLRSLVAGSLGLVLPSLDEGFGLPVLEAAAAGRPVAASDIPVLREVAAPGTTFVAASDVEAWADALQRLAVGPDAHADRDLRRDHAGQWSWARCADRTVDAYRLAISLTG